MDGGGKLPDVRASQQKNKSRTLKSPDSKPSSLRVVNFVDNFGLLQQTTDNSPKLQIDKPLNISHEISRMIPVRGPSLFERQLQEFVSDGNASKSGMAGKKSATAKSVVQSINLKKPFEVEESKTISK